MGVEAGVAAVAEQQHVLAAAVVADLADGVVVRHVAAVGQHARPVRVRVGHLQQRVRRRRRRAALSSSASNGIGIGSIHIGRALCLPAGRGALRDPHPALGAGVLPR